MIAMTMITVTMIMNNSCDSDNNESVFAFISICPFFMIISKKFHHHHHYHYVYSNLVFAEISKLEDVKASCNWMWAAKLPGTITGF